jgi:aminopeptidase N
MENWGLVIFRHQAMVFNPHMDTSLKRASSVIQTIVHELAHQWFGDLVTMAWWSDLTLNEGHAEYWASVGAFGIFPDQAGIFVSLLTQ